MSEIYGALDIPFKSSFTVAMRADEAEAWIFVTMDRKS